MGLSQAWQDAREKKGMLVLAAATWLRFPSSWRRFDLPPWELLAYALVPAIRGALTPAPPAAELVARYDPATCQLKPAGQQMFNEV